ncbi:flagellar biosynthesis anti-sigma factor FlgM [Pantoea allii]|nr:flagellar biosynthesis anti-sigma factor FlgM [Pantoea allii]
MMKITSTQYAMTRAINQANATTPSRSAGREDMKISRSAAIDPVIGEAQTKLSALPEVDMAQVAAVKDAIATGQISIDLDALAHAIEQYHQR